MKSFGEDFVKPQFPNEVYIKMKLLLGDGA